MSIGSFLEAILRGSPIKYSAWSSEKYRVTIICRAEGTGVCLGRTSRSRLNLPDHKAYPSHIDPTTTINPTQMARKLGRPSLARLRGVLLRVGRFLLLGERDVFDAI